VVTSERKIGIRKRRKNIAEGLFRDVQARVVAVYRVRVARGINAGMRRRAVAERWFSRRIIQHRARRIENDSESRTCIRHLADAGRHVRRAGLRHAIHARSDHRPIAVERGQSFVHRAVKSVIKTVANLADKGAVYLEFTRAAARLTCANGAYAAERALDIKLRLRVDAGDTRQDVNNATAATAAAIVTGSGLLRARAFWIRFWLRITTTTARCRNKGRRAHRHRIANKKHRSARATATRIIAVAATTIAIGIDLAVDRQRACLSCIHSDQNDPPAAIAARHRVRPKPIAVTTPLVTTRRAKIGHVNGVIKRQSRDRRQSVVVAAIRYGDTSRIPSVHGADTILFVVLGKEATAAAAILRPTTPLPEMRSASTRIKHATTTAPARKRKGGRARPVFALPRLITNALRQDRACRVDRDGIGANHEVARVGFVGPIKGNDVDRGAVR